MISTTTTTLLWYLLSLLSYSILYCIVEFSPLFKICFSSTTSGHLKYLKDKDYLSPGFARASTFASQVLFIFQWYLRYSETISFYTVFQTLPWCCFVLSGINVIILLLDGVFSGRFHTDNLSCLFINIISCLGVYVFPYDLLIIFVSITCVLCTTSVVCTCLTKGDKGFIRFNTFILAMHLRQWGKFVFYTTGHKLDISSLQLSVGFIGCDSFKYWYAGTALAANTFGPICIEILLLCLTSFWFRNTSNRSAHPYFSIHLILILSYWGYRAYVMLCSVIAIFILRNHLMLWAIFAPKVRITNTPALSVNFQNFSSCFLILFFGSLLFLISCCFILL